MMLILLLNYYRGGRLGVYCDSQEQIKWSALTYRCNADLPKDVLEDLPDITWLEK